MSDNTSDKIKSALQGCFDTVCDLFDGLNMPEHKNELLCFVGLDSYSVSEPVYGALGAQRVIEAKYLVKALAKRGMSAKELCDSFDEKAVPALMAAGLEPSQIKRGSCAYSREQGRHTVFAELTLKSCENTGEAFESLSVSVDGTQLYGLTSYEISRSVKTGETPTLGAGIRSRIVGIRPTKITLRGNLGFAAPSVYTQLSTYLGSAVPQTVAVAGMSFSGMVMTGLELVGNPDKTSRIEAVFTEVNET